MQLLSKREADMTPEEKVKLDLARIILIGKGLNLRSASDHFDLTNGSRVMRTVEMIFKKVKVAGFRDPEDAQSMLPEHSASWPGQAEYEQLMAATDEQRMRNAGAVAVQNDLLMKEVLLLNSKTQADVQVEQSKRYAEAEKRRSLEEVKRHAEAENKKALEEPVRTKKDEVKGGGNGAKGKKAAAPDVEVGGDVTDEMVDDSQGEPKTQEEIISDEIGNMTKDQIKTYIADNNLDIKFDSKTKIVALRGLTRRKMLEKMSAPKATASALRPDPVKETNPGGEAGERSF